MRFRARFARLVALGLPAAAWAGSAGARLDLVAADVRAVAWQGDVVFLRLAPAAAARLRALTRDGPGRRLAVTLDVVPLPTARVQAEVDTGVVQIPQPSDAVQQRLRAIGSGAAPTGR